MIKKFMALLMALFTALAFAAVDVNKADTTQLDAVKGIGPTIAGKITAERAKGPFKDWNDFVTRVPGIGEKSAANLSAAGLTVNGAGFKGMVAKPDVKPDAKSAAAATTKAAAPAAIVATAAATPAPAKPMTDTKAPAMAAKDAPKADAKAMSADEKKAAAKKEKDENAAAARKAKEEKAAAAKKEKEEKAAAKK